VVLTVCMAFVVIVPISIFLAVVLTVCMAFVVIVPISIFLAVVLTVCMAFVVIVPISIFLAVVLSITVCLGLNVTAMAVTVIFSGLGFLVAQNGGAKHYASHGNCSDGDQLLFANIQFFCVDFHIHS
jgi:hypothetical protein